MAKRGGMKPSGILADGGKAQRAGKQATATPPSYESGRDKGRQMNDMDRGTEAKGTRRATRD